ncbi:concanavalin A-like lectin/glucanase [Jaminaea rosea]|uniref:Concanavalin A-like lectin/glucanase n=1 Tax=Jaminaea rosea TaxID=1569628 RepID=A0A316UP22_9BASI|nr:concanavalin A-like lectin/glucanase [Jaminaea rosea]PWN26714.1 concanavalin A-like lectin/glucanase [Jaminaea rosea]
MFKSQLLRDGEEPYKPWVGQKSRKRADRKAYWTFVVAVCLGIVGAAALVATGYLSVKKHNFCLVMEDNFEGTTINDKIWFHEQQTGGFGNGEFEYTTASPNNSYVKDGQLYIVPTLTADSLGEGAITNGYTLNLTASNTCTSSNTSDVYCAVASNSSTGVVLPPVQSARLMTNFSTAIKYGRVEIRAKMPTGNWIWPALWMMPQSSVYGTWPKSGEIDIFESRGNLIKSKDDDTYNVMHSTLHWGLDSMTDRYLKTSKVYQLYRNWYNQQFHTFGLEWTPEGIYTWVDTPTRKVFSWKFDQSFWERGQFPTVSSNGTGYSDPWPKNSLAAPFDQKFYLIMSVAVGGTNGYFDEDDMPWSNNADNARKEFWNAKDSWYPTWPQAPEDRGMLVDYVKVYQLDGVDGAACPAK